MLGGSLIVKRTACSGYLFKKTESKNCGHFWVFEKNPTQRVACFRYFKNLKEPLGFMKEQLVGCWLIFLQSQDGAGSFKFWSSPVICQYIYSNLWWWFGLVLCGSFFEENLQSHFWHSKFIWRIADFNTVLPIFKAFGFASSILFQIQEAPWQLKNQVQFHVHTLQC